MGNHPLLLLLVASFAASSFARDAVPTTNTSYVIVTSNALIPGSELVIDLQLFDLILPGLEGRDVEDKECILDLSVTSEGHIWHRSEWEIDVGDKPKSFHKTLKVLVSLDENKLEEETSELKIESSSCFKFSHSVQVPVTRKDLLVSIRTDKSKYRPGEYVLIESLVLTHELRPHWNPVNLSVHNSRHEVLARWLNITAEEGLIRESLRLSRLAGEDELTITLESHEQQVNHTVDIELPSGPYETEKFDVEIRSPRYLNAHFADESKRPSLDISVAASHDSGLPVSGDVELGLSLIDGSELKSMTPVELEVGHKLISLNLDEVKEVLGLKKDESLVGRTVKIQVKVVEGQHPERKDKEAIKDDKIVEDVEDDEDKKEKPKESDEQEKGDKEDEKEEDKKDDKESEPKDDEDKTEKPKESDEQVKGDKEEDEKGDKESEPKDDEDEKEKPKESDEQVKGDKEDEKEEDKKDDKEREPKDDEDKKEKPKESDEQVKGDKEDEKEEDKKDDKEREPKDDEDKKEKPKESDEQVKVDKEDEKEEDKKDDKEREPKDDEDKKEKPKESDEQVKGDKEDEKEEDKKDDKEREPKDDEDKKEKPKESDEQVKGDKEDEKEEDKKDDKEREPKDDEGKKEEPKEPEDKEKEKREDERVRVERDVGEEKPRLRPEVSVTRVVYVTFVEQTHVLFFSEFTPLYFKPGLSYVGQVLLKQVDESLPLETKEQEVTVKAKLYDGASDTPKEEVHTLKMESNSIGEFSFKLPENTQKLELEATFDDKESGKIVTAHLEELLPFSSEDGHHIQVSSEQKPPKVLFGETLEVKIESTFPTDEFLYEVFCQSLLVLSGNVSLPSPTTSHKLSLLIPHNVSHLLSTPRLVVLALTPSNEIVSDSLRFVTEREYVQPLELKLLSEEVQPGKTVELLVRAEPSTNVYLLTASDLLVFEPNEQKIRELKALENMLRYLRYLNSSQFAEAMDELCESCTTVPSLAPDSERVFNESMGLLLSDGLLHKDPSKPWPVPSRKNGTLDDLESQDIQSLLEFEPRLWKLNVTVGSTGEGKLKFVVPEEGKLYTLAAFGLRPGKGLVVAEEPVQLLVTNKILAELRHPYSSVRGEELVLEVLLFNNQDKEVEVEVSFKEEPGFDLCLTEKLNGGLLSTKLKAKQTRAVPFHVKTSPTLQEHLELKLEIQSEDVHIKLNTTLHVDYQGFEIDRQKSSVLNNFEGDQVLHIDLPKSITNPLEKSDRGHVKIYGHPLGPAIEYVCWDLDEPCLFSERLKLWFVVAVNVLEHIANNSLFDKLSPVNYDKENLKLNSSFRALADKDECIKSARDVLEYLLSKRNHDGSVSFYPSQPGFIWLTTLMLDANLQLKNVRSLDVEEVVETLEWLVSRQKDDGSFEENEKVVQLRSDLDKLSHDVPLTSKVVASLLEASRKLELPEKTSELIKSSTEKASEYILNKILDGELDDDAYSLNVAAYALTLAKNDKVFQVLVKRDNLVVDEDGEHPHWKVNLERPSERRSLSVEATAYGVLTYLAMNDLSGAGPFVEYLMSQMGPAGIFVTTEDTNVALKALSRYYRLLDIYNQHSRVNVDVNVTLSGKETVSLKALTPLFLGELYFVHSNISLSGPMTVESSGEGLVLVQTRPEFNEVEPSSKQSSVDLKLEVKTIDPEHLELKVCAENLEKEKSNFILGGVPLLSGYDLNLEQLKRSQDLQVLKQNDYVLLVFNEVEPSTPKCVELVLDRLYPVGNLEPKFVRLAPTNDLELSVYKSYSREKSDEEMESMCLK